MMTTFIFRNKKCWLTTAWYPGIFHFNFAPVDNDYIDEQGDSYFIHCTYEPEEENKFWFSLWYKNDCIEADMATLTQNEREYIKEEILKRI